MKRTNLPIMIILSIVLAVFMCMNALADDVIMDGSGFFDQEWLKGDLNLDGVVDMNDAVLLLQHSLFSELYPLSYTGNVDFTGDGYVDMNDAILVLQYSMFPDIYPI